MAELKYKDITEKIIGASFEVHKFLGNGFQEVIYQRALAWELKQAGLSFAREIEQDIFYKELPEPIGTRRADFVVEGKVLVELTLSQQDGALLSTTVVKSSGTAKLDQLALSAIAKGKYPPPPPGMTAKDLTFRVPFAFE